MNTHSPLLNVLNKSIRISGKKLIRDFGEIEKLQSSLGLNTKLYSTFRDNFDVARRLAAKKLERFKWSIKWECCKYKG